jgi:hypothetical protein
MHLGFWGSSFFSYFILIVQRGFVLIFLPMHIVYFDQIHTLYYSSVYISLLEMEYLEKGETAFNFIGS